MESAFFFFSHAQNKLYSCTHVHRDTNNTYKLCCQSVGSNCTGWWVFLSPTVCLSIYISLQHHLIHPSFDFSPPRRLLSHSPFVSQHAISLASRCGWDEKALHNFGKLNCANGCAHAPDWLAGVCASKRGKLKEKGDSLGSFSIIASLQDCGVLRVYGWTAASIPFENGTNALTQTANYSADSHHCCRAAKIWGSELWPAGQVHIPVLFQDALTFDSCWKKRTASKTMSQSSSNTTP